MRRVVITGLGAVTPLAVGIFSDGTYSGSDAYMLQASDVHGNVYSKAIAESYPLMTTHSPIPLETRGCYKTVALLDLYRRG